MMDEALEDFIDCVEAVGVQYLSNDGWVDLELAYYHAREVVGRPFNHLNENVIGDGEEGKET